MPSEKNANSKAGSLKDPEIAKLFFTEDPHTLYEDLKEVGHGSFGAVYCARNVQTGETVAIKKMSYGGKQSHLKWQDIIKEVQFLTQIKHPNCVDYKGCYLKDSTAWLAMEYCIGSASDLVEVHKHPLQEEEIAGIIFGAMQGLHYLHQQKKIHRDVKAGNILLTDMGQVKLADFGSASVSSKAISFVGTPYWMAPEVILAMNETHYDDKADIWSMGITCLELAERTPPYFNMNAMAALYQIAQKEPPTLKETESDDGLTITSWSQDFKDFVHELLQKLPSDRPSSSQVLQHPFLMKARSPAVLQDLIYRTKDVVKNLNNLQYRKMKKILIHETRNLQRKAAAGAAMQSGDHHGTIEEDGESTDGKTSSLGSLQSNPSLVSATSSSKSDSISSLNDSNMSDGGSINSQEGVNDYVNYEHQTVIPNVATSTSTSLHSSSSSIGPSMAHQHNINQHQLPQQRMSHLHHTNKSNASADSNKSSSAAAAALSRSSSGRINAAAGGNSGGLTSNVSSIHQSNHHHQQHHHQPHPQQHHQQHHQQQHQHHQQHQQQQHHTGAASGDSVPRGIRGSRSHRDRFATIRSVQVINRQLNEHNEDNRHREQLQGYKRMRQQNQKQLIQYEKKLKAEMDEYSGKLTKELDTIQHQYQQEYERMVKRHHHELDKDAKGAVNHERKFLKHLDQEQDGKMKEFLNKQKKEYKMKKEQMKENSSGMNMSKEDRSEWLNRHMNDLLHTHEQTENAIRDRYQQNRDLEIRKHQRRALLERHNLENNCLLNELNLKQDQRKEEHDRLIAQHDSTQTLEYKQLSQIQDLRMERLRSQHQTEMTNQQEYSQQREGELKRKHMQAMRAQPKHLKQKESQIKKQFQEMVKVQEKQYKAWRNHVVETTPRKMDQKEVLRRKKDEQVRKIALLNTQYENSVSDLNQKQTVKLSESQEKERQHLKHMLNNEEELLTAFQSKVKMVSEQQHERELKELEQKVSVRRALLEDRMGEDMNRLHSERSSRIKTLLDVQGRQIEQFDDESLKLGFSTVVITDYGDQVSLM